MRLVDTHAHLEELDTLSEVIAQAKAAGLIAVVAVGLDLASNQKVLKIAGAYPGFVYPALGLHPWNLKAGEVDMTLEHIEANISEAVGIGEIGLDYQKRVRENAGKELQMQTLARILKLARQYDKPALVHSRYAWQDAFDVVVASGVEKVVFHWYTGTSSVLREIVRRGFYVSATPAVEYHAEHQRAIKETPPERLLLETDTPVTYQRGTEFEFSARPASVLRSLKGMAKLKGLSEEELAEITTQNAVRLFGLPF